MKALMRGFLAGFGFALGASMAGTLIGYTIGKLGEASVKRFFSPEPTPSPQPSSSPTSSEPSADTSCEPSKTDIRCGAPNPDFEGHFCTLTEGHPGSHADLIHGYHGPAYRHGAPAHKSHYGVATDGHTLGDVDCRKCESEGFHGVRHTDALAAHKSNYGAPVCEHGYQLSPRSIEIGISVHMATGKLCGDGEGPSNLATSEGGQEPEHHSDDYGAERIRLGVRRRVIGVQPGHPGTLCSRHARGRGANGDPAGCLMCLAEKDEQQNHDMHDHKNADGEL